MREVGVMRLIEIASYSGETGSLVPRGDTFASTRMLAIPVAMKWRVRSQLMRIPAPDPVARLYNWLAVRVTDAWLITLLATVLSVCSYAWYARSGLTVGYGDAVSRMMIARRVVAGRTPGLAQLGTTWLPLHTMLMLPLIWNDTLFHDGFAGSFPSMVAYVVASVYIYRMARFLFALRGAAWAAALAFMLNPSVAYMQSTAMSEVPLLCTATAAIYYMLRWAKSYHAADLVKSAVAVAAGTGIRYDGWALAIALAAVVIYLAWRRQGYNGAEAWGILYGLLGFSGCAAWMIYNAVIFHDPMLFFFFGDSTHTFHPTVSYHKAWLSFEMYGYSAAATAGWMTALLAGLGVGIFAFRNRLRASILPAYALLIPLAYHWLIFYMGKDTIWLPELGLGVYWNARFALELIPAVAIFVGGLAKERRLLLIAVLGVVAVFGVVDSALETPFALREVVSPKSATIIPREQMAAQWFLTQYRGGNVLISYIPDAPMAYFMMRDVPDRALITDSTGWQFDAALAYPQDSVKWIILDEDQTTQDRVWLALHNRQDWRRYFVLRKVIDPGKYFWRTEFYERIGPGSTGPAGQSGSVQAQDPQQTPSSQSAARQARAP
jgi:Dolichyl-phosphate-mannose-protein mannosyltransferase